MHKKKKKKKGRKKKKSADKAQGISAFTDHSPGRIQRLILIGAESKAKTIWFSAWIQVWKVAQVKIHLEFFVEISIS